LSFSTSDPTGLCRHDWVAFPEPRPRLRLHINHNPKVIIQDDGLGHDADAERRRARLSTLCQQHYQQVRERVHTLLARDVRRGRPWLAALLSTGDVVHEVFLGVVRDFDDYRGTSEQAFVAYLARLVRNRLIDSVRHHQASRRDRRLVTADLVDAPSRSRSPDASLVAAEDAERLGKILAGLGERDRALLRGRLEDDEPFQSLAESLGYASADSARKALVSVQARVLARLQRAKESKS
jgi:RNA polymerase sigma factor (sigma-70 family)